jgi:hypothetical protein
MGEATEQFDGKGLNREQLNAAALERAIPDPVLYDTKDEVIVAIQAADAGDPIPAPPKAKEGTTVTLTESEDGHRSVRVGEDRFVIDTPVTGISAATVKELKKLEGFTFSFES